MLDSYSIRWIKHPLSKGANVLHAHGITANQITLFGFFIGCMAFVFLSFQAYLLALVCILLNRIFDGLDGALARIQGLTDAGGFLDICLDFLFYSLIPLGFIFADVESNAFAGALLIFSFVGTGSSFLAFAILANKHHIQNTVYQNKSFYYMTGLTGGTETIICFVLFCLFPESFAALAYVFAAMCLFTTFSRIYFGFTRLKNVELESSP